MPRARARGLVLRARGLAAFVRAVSPLRACGRAPSRRKRCRRTGLSKNLICHPRRPADWPLRAPRRMASRETPAIENRPQHLAMTAVQQLYADPAAAAAQATDKIAAARVWLLKEKPFFGVLSRALTIEATLQTPAFRLTAHDR